MILNDTIDYHCSSKENPKDNNGIGDVITALYTIRAIAKAHPDKTVRFKLHEHLFPWARLGWNNVVKHDDESKGDQEFWSILTSYLHHDQFAEHRGCNRHEEMADRFGVKIEPFQVRACTAEDTEWAKASIKAEDKPVVFLAPFSTSRQRSWPYRHWIKLQLLLSKENVRVCSMDGPQGEKSLKHMPGKVYWGQNPQRTIALFRQANLVVGCDSGLVHLAGMLQLPALALCAPTLGKIAFGWYPSVNVMQAEGACTGCYWSAKRQYQYECNFDCGLMHDMKPEVVCARILSILHNSSENKVL